MKTAEFRSLLLRVTKEQELDLLHQSIAEYEYSDPVKVAFLGEFTTGKSTLINALLQRSLIPMLDQPTNANPIEIRTADADSYEIVRRENGDEQVTAISQDQLPEEVINYEAGKEIRVFLQGIDFLSDDVVLIDTPGISSLNELHSHVTYGYIPFIDAAVFMISAISGEATESVLEFIKNEIIPIEGLKDRLFFCVTMLDTIPPDHRDRVFSKIRSSLEDAIPGARIVDLSPIAILDRALKGDLEAYHDSGIDSLIRYIKIELPEKKIKIADEKLCHQMRKFKEKVITQLEYKLSSLDYSTDDMDREIDNLKTQISELERTTKQYRKEMEKAQDRIRERIQAEKDALIDTIAFLAANDQDYTESINSFSSSVNEIIIRNLAKVNIPSHDSENSFSKVILAKIEANVAIVQRVADIVAKIATSLVTAWLIPGKTAVDAAGAAAVAAEVAVEAAEQAAKKAARAEAFKKFLRFAGQFLDEINPINDVKDIGVNVALGIILKSRLGFAINQILDSVLQIVNDDLDRMIDESCNQPINQHKKTLDQIREKKSTMIDDIDTLKVRIIHDIRSLKDNGCSPGR